MPKPTAARLRSYIRSRLRSLEGTDDPALMWFMVEVGNRSGGLDDTTLLARWWAMLRVANAKNPRSKN